MTERITYRYPGIPLPNEATVECLDGSSIKIHTKPGRGYIYISRGAHWNEISKADVPLLVEALSKMMGVPDPSRIGEKLLQRISYLRGEQHTSSDYYSGIEDACMVIREECGVVDGEVND